MLPLGDGLGDRYVMVDEKLIERLCDYAEVSDRDVVLEVGAGTGNLTEALLDRGCSVIAVERDKRFFEYLTKAFPMERKLKLICGDATKIRFPSFNKVVSNMPYSISKKITVRLISEGFEKAVLVFQREFARKLVAKPPSSDYRFISALVQSSCEVKLLEEVSPEAFSPKPNVWSAVVSIKPLRKLEKDYAIFLQKLFNHKNKKIRNVLENAPKEYAEKKPVDLQPEEFTAFYQKTKTIT